MRAKLKDLKPANTEAIRRASVSKESNNNCVVNLANKIREELRNKMKNRKGKGRYDDSDTDDITESDIEDDEKDY